MRIRVSNLVEYAKSRLWVMPTAFLLGAVILSQVALIIDKNADFSDRWFVFPGGPESARELLSTIASVTFTFTALVFSITMVVLQLASSQLSPRVMRLFLRDTGTQIVLATFLASFAYSMLILREVRSGDDSFVPGLAIWIAFVFVVIDIALFIFYINHMTQRIRASSVIWAIGTETLGTIDRKYPDPYEEGAAAARAEPGRPAVIIPNSSRGGPITYVDYPALRDAARDQRLIIKLLPATGDFVTKGADLLKVWPQDPGEADAEELRRLENSISFSKERTLQQDVGFGLRQLVDIAERALSTGVNDPTTAVQALDQVHEILVSLIGRAIPTEADRSDPFLIVNEPDWEDFVSMGLDEIRIYGKGSLQITRRIRNIIETLLAMAPPARHAPLHRQLQLIDDAIATGFDSPLDRENASRGSAQGAGPRS